MTTTTSIKADRFMNRAPKGGAVSPVNGQFYHGGQFMPMFAMVVSNKPLTLMGSVRQVAWANRLRAAEMARLDDEIHARLLFVTGRNKTEAAEYRPIVLKLLIARHGVMTERSASVVIDRHVSARA